MASAARVSVWTARGRTVDLLRLAGPLSGTFVPPPYLPAARPVYDLGDPEERLAAYELLLAHGNADDLARWINLDELCRCLDALKLPAHVVGPWRGALRVAGLLPVESAPPDSATSAVEPRQPRLAPVVAA